MQASFLERCVFILFCFFLWHDATLSAQETTAKSLVPVLPQNQDEKTQQSNAPQPAEQAPSFLRSPPSQPLLMLSRVSQKQAVAAIGFQPSSQVFYNNAFNRQSGVPRPDQSFLETSNQGLTFIFGSPDTLTRLAGAPDAGSLVDNSSIIANLKGGARADAVFDTTRINPNTQFLPSRIPAKGEPFFGTGERADVLLPGVGTHLLFNTQSNTSLGKITTFSDIQIISTTDSSAGLDFRLFWGQFQHLIAGKADSIFSDPDAIPNTIDVAGPNGSLNVQHPLLGYVLPFSVSEQKSFFAIVSAEAPEPKPFLTDPAKQAAFSSIPDFAGKVRWEDQSWGHVQLSALVRDIGIENASNSLRDEVLGWGTHASGALIVFRNQCLGIDDTVNFGVNYGHGIGNYINDTRGLNGSDAAFDSNGVLKAIPAYSYYFSYSHYWTANLRSTAVYSEVHLDSLPSQITPTSSPYTDGRYISANLFYQWNFKLSNDPKDMPAHTAFTGLEVLYGEKGNLSQGRGNDTRVQFTLGAKY